MNLLLSPPLLHYSPQILMCQMSLNTFTHHILSVCTRPNPPFSNHISTTFLSWCLGARCPTLASSPQRRLEGPRPRAASPPLPPSLTAVTPLSTAGGGSQRQHRTTNALAPLLLPLSLSISLSLSSPRHHRCGRSLDSSAGRASRCRLRPRRGFVSPAALPSSLRPPSPPATSGLTLDLVGWADSVPAFLDVGPAA
jgi:hypothetical protein